MKVKIALQGAIGLLATLMIACPLWAAELEALQQAQQLEADGDFATAAGAYLAIVEDFDFLPGNTNTQSALSIHERILIGKCAMNCIEIGMKRHIAENRDYDCPEAQLLGAASSSMMKLEPTNARWTYLLAFSQMQKGNLKEASELIDQCLSQAGNDRFIAKKAEKARTRINKQQAQLISHVK